VFEVRRDVPVYFLPLCSAARACYRPSHGIRAKLDDIQSETAFRQTKQQPKTVVSEQVCVQPPTYTNNVALPAFGRAAID